MISSICWLPKGAAKAVPLAAPMNEEELAFMREQAADIAAGVLEVRWHPDCCWSCCCCSWLAGLAGCIRWKRCFLCHV